jgi:hypothetical protein
LKITKLVIIFLCFLLVSATSLVIQRAEANTGSWSRDWEAYGNFESQPENVSSAGVFFSGDGHRALKVVLVASIWDYYPEYSLDKVFVKVAVYIKATADPGYEPQYATDVSIQFDKIESDQDQTIIWVIPDELPHGYSQGYGLFQSTATTSTHDQRALWALQAIEFAAGFLYEPAGTAIGVINLATAFVPSGSDIHQADYADSYADSWWHNSVGWYEDTQYCFNCIRWKQNKIEPSIRYGLKIWATVLPDNPNAIPPITMPPIYLYITAPQGGHGGGSLCPTLFVWSGTEYVEEGLLGIHADSDITLQHRIQNSLALENGVYKLQLRELDNFTSHIDQVKLCAVDYEGKSHLCPLVYAYHSELGRVTWKLLFDDENKANLEPTQVIDLKFLPSILRARTAYCIFEINGHNRKTEE